jgi:hypothetical protein
MDCAHVEIALVVVEDEMKGRLRRAVGKSKHMCVGES